MKNNPPENIRDLTDEPVNGTQPEPVKARQGIQPGQNVSDGLAGEQDIGLKNVARTLITKNSDRIRNMTPDGAEILWSPAIRAPEMKRMIHAIYRDSIPENADEILDIPMKGIAPDGGVFSIRYQGMTTPCVVAESKYQGKLGNAIERWYTNYFMATALNRKVAYVTFCSGAGCEFGEVMHKTLNIARIMDAAGRGVRITQWNQPNGIGPSFHSRILGFSSQQFTDTLLDTLELAIPHTMEHFT